MLCTVDVGGVLMLFSIASLDRDISEHVHGHTTTVSTTASMVVVLSVLVVVVVVVGSTRPRV